MLESWRGCSRTTHPSIENLGGDMTISVPSVSHLVPIALPKQFYGQFWTTAIGTARKTLIQTPPNAAHVHPKDSPGNTM